MSLVPCWDDAATKAAEQVLARRLQCSHWHPAKTPEMRCCDFRHSCGTSCCPSKRTTIEASANLGNFQTWHEDVCLDRQRHSLFCSIGTGGWSLSDTPFSIVPAVVASDFDSSSSEEESEPLGFVGCVRCCLHPPITGHGHPRQANCPRLALAERLRRKTDRIDPTRVCRPYCRPGRSAFRRIASRGSMTQPLNPSRSARRSLSPNVAVLGVVSLLMGMSSAMIYGLLPVFLVTVLGATTAAVGLIEGTAEATTSLVKIFSGVVSDWIGRRKPLVALGYGLSAVNKLLFPFAEFGIGRAGGTYRRPARQGNAGCSTRCAAGRCDPRRNSRHGVRPAAGTLHGRRRLGSAHGHRAHDLERRQFSIGVLGCAHSRFCVAGGPPRQRQRCSGISLLEIGRERPQNRRC